MSTNVQANPLAQRPDLRALRAGPAARSTTLAERADLAGMFRAGDWNTIAVRMQGPKLWLLINDQVALSAVDSAQSSGDVILGVTRMGPVDDTEEATIVLRNLRVSQLAQVEAGRAATYLQPPAPSALVVEDPLTGMGLLSSGVCRNEKTRTAFTAEGFEMRVAGRCQPTSNTAAFSTPYLRGLTLPDGEVRFEVKFGAELERTLFRLFFRTDEDSGNSYSLNINPGRGAAYFVRWTNNDPTSLTGRDDLAWLLQKTDWNSVAVRAIGNQLWLLLNDQPVLFVLDDARGTGAAGFNLTRLGNPDDQQEVVAVIRNLRVSSLVNSP